MIAITRCLCHFLFTYNKFDINWKDCYSNCKENNLIVIVILSFIKLGLGVHISKFHDKIFKWFQVVDWSIVNLTLHCTIVNKNVLHIINYLFIQLHLCINHIYPLQFLQRATKFTVEKN